MSAPSFVNYGRNVRFSPATIETPSSTRELIETVRRSTKLRVVGSGHSWSDAIVTDGTLVSLDRMRRVVDVDAGALLATVEAGIKIKELIVALEDRGLAIQNLGSITEQAIAGAISTGTHGTGIGWKCLASQVASLDLVDGEGHERTLRPGDPDFDAVVVGLGAFGVVHRLTLGVAPSFQMHAITDLGRFDDVIDRLDELVHGYDHFKLWWLPPGDEVILFMNRRTTQPRNDSDLLRWFKDDFLSVYVYRTLVALEELDRKRLVPLVNRTMGRQVGKRFDRITKSYVGFRTPVPPVHRETEWAFDVRDAKRLLREYREVFLESGHTFNFIQEIRFAKGDSYWLSPAFERDSIWLGLYNMDSDERWNDQLRRFEAFARRNEGRPHWGKEADFDPAYLRRVYPRLGDFRALAKSYDPAGKLENPWLARLLGGA